MRTLYILFILAFISTHSTVTASSAQGSVVIASKVILNSSPITAIDKDTTHIPIECTHSTIPSTRTMMVWSLFCMDTCIEGIWERANSTFALKNGLSSEYIRADGSFASFPTNLSSFSNGPGYITSADVKSIQVLTGLTKSSSSGADTLSITPTGVAAGTYGAVTVNVRGQVTAGKRLELFSGTTNGSGVYSASFSAAFSVAPNIQASITNQSTTNQFIRVSSVSTTAFTINVFQRSAVTILGIEVLLAATTNVSGATVDVLVTEK